VKTECRRRDSSAHAIASPTGVYRKGNGSRIGKLLAARNTERLQFGTDFGFVHAENKQLLESRQLGVIARPVQGRDHGRKIPEGQGSVFLIPLDTQETAGTKAFQIKMGAESVPQGTHQFPKKRIKLGPGHGRDLLGRFISEPQIGLLNIIRTLGCPALNYIKRNDVGRLDAFQGVGDQGTLIESFFNLHGLQAAGFIRRHTMVTYN
jgi:hypothetical protein